MTLNNRSTSCVVLADRHPLVTEGIRGLLGTSFDTVYTVADALSLEEGVRRLIPDLVVVDLSLIGRGLPHLLQDVRSHAPQCRTLVLCVDDKATVARVALASGAQGVILKRSVGSDLLPAIDASLRGEVYLSPGFNLDYSATPER